MGDIGGMLEKNNMSCTPSIKNIHAGTSTGVHPKSPIASGFPFLCPMRR